MELFFNDEPETSDEERIISINVQNFAYNFFRSKIKNNLSVRGFDRHFRFVELQIDANHKSELSCGIPRLVRRHVCDDVARC